LPLVFAAARRVSGDALAATAILCLYAINPYAVFRVIGYTEAIFAIEVAVMILLLQRWQEGRRDAVTLTALAVVTALASLTRPLLPQIAAAAPAALLTVALVRKTFRDSADQRGLLSIVRGDWGLVRLVSLLILAAAAGYAVYGLYCLQQTGEFLHPFSEQRHWGKKLGFYPWNLIWPFAGHNEFMGLYFPVLLLLVALWRLGRSRRGQSLGPWRILPVWASIPLAIEPSLWLGVHAIHGAAQLRNPALRGPAQAAEPLPRWAESFVFWFCLFMAGAHGGLILLTDRTLQSLARFIFAQPFFFVALATLAPLVPKRWRGLAFGFAFIASALLLIGIWGLYAHDLWIG
jgi:hypothetical protein